MGFLDNFNNKIWSYLFQFSSIVSDSAILGCLLYSSVFALIISLIRHKISHKGYCFGIADWIFSFSIAGALKSLPDIQPLLNNAFQTTISVIKTYPDCQESFISRTGLGVEKASEMVNYLYQNPVNSLRGSGEFLWEHFYNAYDKVLSVGPLGYIQESTFGESIAITILVIITLVIAFLAVPKHPKEMLIFCVKAAIIIILAKMSNGAVICAIWIWLVEAAMASAFEKIKLLSKKEKEGKNNSYLKK